MSELKVLSSLEEKLVFKANSSHIPISASFELTPVCNLNCDMCFIRMSKFNQTKEIAIQEWLRIAESLRKNGTLFILLTGGEPLMYSHFVELYVALRKMGFIVTINTNGTLITDEIAEVFSSYKPRRVNITLYGANSDTYECLCHNRKGFHKCIEGIHILQKKDIDIKLNVTLVKKNKKDFDSIISISKKIGVPVVVNSYMLPCMRSNCDEYKSIEKARLQPKQAAQLIVDYFRYQGTEEFNDFRKHSLENLTKEEFNISPIELDCRAGKSSCWIDWQGRMTPCVALEHPSVSLLKTDVKTAWEYIVDQSKTLVMFGECEGCNLRSICNVCYAAACHEKKALGNLNYLCEMAQWKKKYLLEE